MNRSAQPIDDTAVQRAVESAAHLLPAQRPLERFVHHNTLHAFESMPFDEAVVAASARFGATPYLSTEMFLEEYDRGRILDADIGAVVAAHVPDEPAVIPGLKLDLRTAVHGLMTVPFSGTPSASVPWLVQETTMLVELPERLRRDARERLLDSGSTRQTLAELWRWAVQRRRKHPAAKVEPTSLRLGALTQRHLAVDIDREVNAWLIRHTAAYLDLGVSQHSMPAREEGFFATTARAVTQRTLDPRPWVRRMRAVVRELDAETMGASAAAVSLLQRIGVAPTELKSFVTDTLLALSGWPGMFVQLAARPDLAPAPPPPTSLIDFLAVRLLLEVSASEEALRHSDGALARGTLIERLQACAAPPTADRSPDPALQLFESVVHLGIAPAALWAATDKELDDFDSVLTRYSDVPRRALWQKAFERRYRQQILDALIAHNAMSHPVAPQRPRAQVICCIDDREESLRRALEELDPRYETYGYAGNYGLKIRYLAAGGHHSVPLSPANAVPTHLLVEDVEPQHREAFVRLQRRDQWLGGVVTAGADATRSVVRGTLASLLGTAAIVPMVTRLLSPERHAANIKPRRAAQTRLSVDAEDPPRAHNELAVGFSKDEMVQIVRPALEEMGLTSHFAPLVAVLGHGSNSMNNPHEAAHDCGACGGGRGGPNARAFASFANDEYVREQLGLAGINIPSTTWFIGGYHNTCTDEFELYDTDLVPAQLGAAVQTLADDLRRACTLDAHERARRFYTASRDLTPEQAVRHVRNRAEDLAEPRPEYGHASNALCLVGRRDWSRGLFLDRRVFLTSYDPSVDENGAVLGRLLASVAPVGAGINLEYYFSFVDPMAYGANTKLPHNITGMIGVMDGHQSDLRTGLPWQMVEIHEPVRLLTIVEGTPDRIDAVLASQPGVAGMIQRGWVLAAAYDPCTNQAWTWADGRWQLHVCETTKIQTAQTSIDYYSGHRGHLKPATIVAGSFRGADNGKAS